MPQAPYRSHGAGGTRPNSVFRPRGIVREAGGRSRLYQPFLNCYWVRTPSHVLHLSYAFHSRGPLSEEINAKVCDAVRTELEKISLTKYVNSILTAFVVKTPPDHESGLALLLRLRGKILTFRDISSNDN